jgi:hypothetical protein
MLALAAIALPASATTLDFEDLGLNLPIANPDSGDPELFYDGYSAYAAGDPTTDFTTGAVTFHNDFNDFGGGCCWQGWAYSQTTDTTTQSFTNQYSAAAGSGVHGSATYGMSFTGSAVAPATQQGISRLGFASERSLVGGWFTNSTLGALTIENGDDFVATPFGGEDGNAEDFFILTITGFDASEGVTGSVDFVLADYRFADNALDYLIDEWTWVDLSALGDVAALAFHLTSSDTSGGFLNTPAYFAMDGLVYTPEPGTGALLALGLGFLARRRR